MIAFLHRRYDMEAIYFDEGVRSSKRQQLESKLLQVSSFFWICYQHTESTLWTKLPLPR
jgi:hypothetical protein